jgi:photosystem II stability/assembly factor-like uncharacterized protein
MKSRIPALLTLGFAVLSSAFAQESLYAGLNARSLGPSTMGGRIVDIAVYEKAPRIFYAASAAGGLWKTVNGGMTMTPVWYPQKASGLGAVAVSATNPDVVWVGTGESTSRNSISWGEGVFMSKDGGKTFNFMGLADTQIISDIVIDPRDDNTVYVAALGRLWGANPERGVFKTTDGGKTWTKILAGKNDTSGAIDLIMDPSNPNTMLCAMWDRERRPWTFRSGGPGSGLFKTTNAGRSWNAITKGWPEGVTGRVGISYFHKNPKIVVATIEAAKFGEGSQRTRTGGTFRSTDGGDSWVKVNDLNPRPFYFSLPRQDPQDENRIYVFGVNAHVSDDKGATFRVMPINNRVHVDYHAAWINPNDNNHMIVGNDGGVYQSRDRGETWEHMNTMVIGQFYAVGFDFRKPYYVYGGLQDNGSWGGPTQALMEGPTFMHWYGVGGGDGFYTQVDWNEWWFLYTESQGGAVGRINLKTGEERSIRPNNNNTFPPLPQGERLRWNWNTPIHLSPHNPRTIYVGANRLFKSVNQGDQWQVLSPDLTTNDPAKQRVGIESVSPEDTGAERHCTITTIGESPLRLGTIWVGTDDGQVHVTQDDGKTWSNVTANIPGLGANAWCTRVSPSRYVAGRAYVTFDNHRLNDFKPYVYVTEDYGKTWTNLGSSFGEGEVFHVIKEGVRNPELLFLGSDTGMHISMDRGKTWSKFKNANFPTTPVHDLAIHPRELDLVIGTHGRSIWILNVAPLEQLPSSEREKDVVLTRPQNVLLLGRNRMSIGDGDRVFAATNSQPGTDIAYYVKTAIAEEGKIEITNMNGDSVATLDAPGKAGLNVVRFNARGRGRLVAGDYKVTLTIGGKEYVTGLKVENATWE